MRLCLLPLLLTVSVVAGGWGGGRSGGGGGRYGSSGGRYGGGSHPYPHSTGYSGTGTGGAHTYPNSNGLSGSSGQVSSKTYNQQNTGYRSTYNSRTEVHNHYHYSPPQQISYGSTYHPVYHGSPPVYVYQYRDSGSRFDSLLTGLALYNLGRMSAGHNNYGDSHRVREYNGSPGEICKLGISKRTGEYEETRIDCKLMSSFIWEADSSRSGQHVVSTNSTVTTVTKVTQNGNETGNGNITSVTVTEKKETTVKDALQVKGPSIEVTPGMTCYMIRISRDTSVLKKNVDCGLLQQYAASSMRRTSGSERLKPVATKVLCILSFLLYPLI